MYIVHSAGTGDEAREQTAKARAVSEDVIIIGEWGGNMIGRLFNPGCPIQKGGVSERTELTQVKAGTGSHAIYVPRLSEIIFL